MLTCVLPAPHAPVRHRSARGRRWADLLEIGDINLLLRVHCFTDILGCVLGSSCTHKDMRFTQMTAWDLQGRYTIGESRLPASGHRGASRGFPSKHAVLATFLVCL